MPLFHHVYCDEGLPRHVVLRPPFHCAVVSRQSFGLQYTVEKDFETRRDNAYGPHHVMKKEEEELVRRNMITE